MSSDDKSKFDSLMFILASAFTFLVVVILISILLIYAARCRRRQQRRRRDILFHFSANGVWPAEVDEPPSPGLDPSVIASMPKLVYNTSQLGEAAECSVCLSTIVEGATVRLLPNCKHLFHGDCVDVWLRSHATCPICRAVAEPRPQPEGGEVQPTAPTLEMQESGTAVDIERF